MDLSREEEIQQAVETMLPEVEPIDVLWPGSPAP